MYARINSVRTTRTKPKVPEYSLLTVSTSLAAVLNSFTSSSGLMHVAGFVVVVALESSAFHSSAASLMALCAVMHRATNPSWYVGTQSTIKAANTSQLTTRNSSAFVWRNPGIVLCPARKLHKTPALYTVRTTGNSTAKTALAISVPGVAPMGAWRLASRPPSSCTRDCHASMIGNMSPNTAVPMATTATTGRSLPS